MFPRFTAALRFFFRFHPFQPASHLAADSGDDCAAFSLDLMGRPVGHDRPIRVFDFFFFFDFKTHLPTRGMLVLLVVDVLYVFLRVPLRSSPVVEDV